MSLADHDYYCQAHAFVEDDGQIDWMGDGVLCQLVTVLLCDDTGQIEPAACALTAREARALAFELLSVAEHAEQRTRHREGDER